MDDRAKQRGADIGNWPELGCGAKFAPWAKGAIMVVELFTGPGVWAGFMAERAPRDIKHHLAAYDLAQKA